MLLKYFYDETLAQASYLLGCPRTGEAMVVDPGRMSRCICARPTRKACALRTSPRRTSTPISSAGCASWPPEPGR